MSKEKKGENPLNQSSKQAVFEALVAEGFEQLGRSSQKAIEEFLAEAKGEKEELRLRRKTANFVRALIGITQGVGDFPLYEETGGRTNWELYLSGLRGLLRDLLDSYSLTIVLPLLELNELGEKLTALSKDGLGLLHSTERVFHELDKYINARVYAAGRTSAYGVDNETLEETYASLKTWKDDEELERFSEDLEDFLDRTLVVIVEGPIQLYLMISRRGFLLIFRALMLKRIGDLSLEDSDLDSLMALHDVIHGRFEEAEGIKLFQALLRKIADQYLEDWREEQKHLRELFPTRESKKAFVERFEKLLAEAARQRSR